MRSTVNPIPLSCPPPLLLSSLAADCSMNTSLWRGHYHSIRSTNAFTKESNKRTWSCGIMTQHLLTHTVQYGRVLVSVLLNFPKWNSVYLQRLSHQNMYSASKGEVLHVAGPLRLLKKNPTQTGNWLNTLSYQSTRLSQWRNRFPTACLGSDYPTSHLPFSSSPWQWEWIRPSRVGSLCPPGRSPSETRWCSPGRKHCWCSLDG